MPIKQWVNLSKDVVHQDETITTTDRCGSLSVKVTAERENPPISYLLRVVPAADNVTYGQDEQLRNPNFRATKGKQSILDTVKTETLDDIRLPAAGGNKYKIEVKDVTGKVVLASEEVEVWRRLYYQVIAMRGVQVPASLKSFEEDFRNEKKKFFIDLVEKGDVRGQMKMIRTVTSYHDAQTGKRTSINGQEFRDEARKVYTIKQLQPYAVAVVFSNYIATLTKLPLQFELNKRNNADSRVTFGANELTVDVKKDQYGDPQYLWHNLSSDDMTNDPKHWLERGTAQFNDQTGRVLNINDNDIAITGPNRGAEGGYRQLRIQLSPIMASYLDTNIVTLKLVVRKVEGFSGGFSYNGLNLITVATKAWWDPSDEQEMLQILNHEMGHKIGMVAYGDKKKSDAPHKDNKDFNENPKLPDSHPKLYGENRGMNDQGHQGPHCSNGADYHGPGTAIGGPDGAWTGRPLCVMFGATGLQDAKTGQYTASPKEFCPDCAKVVRKVDLDGNGLDGLKGQF